jgi:hypothetical protein
LRIIGIRNEAGILSATKNLARRRSGAQRGMKMLKRIGEMWKHLSIRVKFLAAFFCVLTLVSVFNLYLNNNNYAITDQFNHMMTNYYAINRMQLLVDDNYNAVTSFL